MKSYSRIADIQSDIANKKTSCIHLVQSCLDAIEVHSNLNAFIDVWEKDALEQASIIDTKIANGSAGKLAGVVIAIKSNMCLEGKRVNASSKILDNFKSLYTATAVQRLIDEDAIIIGSSNCDEMAMGASSENSAYGPVLNAADKAYVPGGSSGGSAVAVQTGMCHAALGSDTGGSIRQPGAFTGTVGYKPSYGVVSRWGLLAYASSFDQIGPITRSTEDAALLTEIISGPDEKDATVSNKQWNLNLDTTPSKKKYAIIKEAMELEGLNAEVKNAFEKGIQAIKDAGNEIEEISFPYLDYVVPTYYVLTTAEASSNLSRYSGLTYGHRSKNAKDLESTFTLSRSEGFGKEVQRRIILGTFVLSSDYYDAYYKKGLQVRQLIRNWTVNAFENYDAILSPTSATPAFKIGEKAANPIAMYLADLLTAHANLAGNPAISIPMPKSEKGLPMGFQIMGEMNKDQSLLSIAHQLEGLVK
ncbi:Asp-tRNA(Asn)/Glu-tRNA(Gln) amidotransferase subunit GatA [Bacteroidia bacterium]|nr:Asp-tRNA(Asn)/Glu-tRNA(Gln) amidotransferase subunit GatA [Bacteroidia bacterium]